MLGEFAFLRPWDSFGNRGVCAAAVSALAIAFAILRSTHSRFATSRTGDVSGGGTAT
jgi:hypothetical protein